MKYLYAVLFPLVILLSTASCNNDDNGSPEEMQTSFFEAEFDGQPFTATTVVATFSELPTNILGLTAYEDLPNPTAAFFLLQFSYTGDREAVPLGTYNTQNVGCGLAIDDAVCITFTYKPEGIDETYLASTSLDTGDPFLITLTEVSSTEGGGIVAGTFNGEMSYLNASFERVTIEVTEGRFRTFIRQ